MGWREGTQYQSDVSGCVLGCSCFGRACEGLFPGARLGEPEGRINFNMEFN